MKPQFQLLAALSGITLHRVVTKDVAQRDKHNKHKIGFGNVSYYKDIIRSTQSMEPVNVFLAPDAGIRPNLAGDNQGEHTRAGEFLLTAGGQNSVTLMMAVEIIGDINFEKSRGKNLRKPYIIHVGNAYTNQEILEKLKDYRARKGLKLSRADRPFEHFDAWLFEEEFPKIAPNKYLANRSA